MKVKKFINHRIRYGDEIKYNSQIRVNHDEKKFFDDIPDFVVLRDFRDRAGGCGGQRLPFMDLGREK
jgi:hypothetical protein